MSDCDSASKVQTQIFVPRGENERPSESLSPSNVYDTYNADQCQRVRRPWNALSSEERDLYKNGLLELRARGNLDPAVDELIAVSSTHDHVGSVAHMDSDYLFWHGYLVWELESRIRSLGGPYTCFGMPYWDWTAEFEHEDDTPLIYQTGLGGYGDPNNNWAVNGFSWDVTTDEYWVAARSVQTCQAEGDACPVCAVKRAGYDFVSANSDQSRITNANHIKNLARFEDFQRWVVHGTGLPPAIDNAYDPIWYLFHSMQSYYQAMWVNCHDYDLIDTTTDDLGHNAMAFHPYCDDDTVAECVGIKLNDPLYFDGVLPDQPWSFIHKEKLTIHKLYSLPQWNVIYDLNGDDFYATSGLKNLCATKLNPEWFIVPTEEEEEDKLSMKAKHAWFSNDAMFITMNAVVGMSVLSFLLLFALKQCIVNHKNKKLNSIAQRDGYGSISV
eukprot:CAMPEP_0202692474 /NCGR_PEP_ID=MMETSP1385-20130828/6836_1 /ASSEMBLY_ACC=CAM_ASM_000861 /TAXON_ID=933848 /ORGANISM="Elphidium margaritaceum" /LENGTH=441 /DNA_ID=CAMNT_0049348007 /DNA_START=153 /DNA_END=1478 /DNA_ORIENTATION=+